MAGVFRRLRARVRNRRFQAELRDELDVHRGMAADELRAAGVASEDLPRAAARQMGNVTLAREGARAVWIAPWLESVWQDARYGARSLRHSPGFTAVALVTLTLGIGVNLALFSLVNALLLQPWRAPDAHDLVLAYHRMARLSGEMLVGVSALELDALGRATTVNVAGTRTVGGALTYQGNTRSVTGRLVSGNYFDVLRAPMTAGRALRDEDNQPGRAALAVIAHDIWTGYLSSDPAIVGATVRFRDVPVTIVGVAAAGVLESPFAGIPEIWLPLWAMPALFPSEPFAQQFMSNPAHCCVDLVGRLRPGVSRAGAAAELSALDRRFRRDDREGLGMRVTGTETLHHPEAGRARPVFALLFAGVGLILLLTAANVGNLQLARASARRREMTVRLALGASRRRVVRQLLTEGLVLAVAATTLCLAASVVVARAVMTRLDASLARVLDFSIDVRVLAFAGGLALVTALVSSLAPALKGTRQLVAARASDTPATKMRSMLLGVQVAASVVLVTAAMLLSRGLAAAAAQDVGYTLDTLMAMRIARPSGTPDADRLFLRDVMEKIGGLPVAAAASAPLDDGSFFTSVRRAGEPYEADRQAQFHPVSSNYFSVLKIPLRAGRSFREGATAEVVINETLARALWPDGDAVGGHLAGPDGTIGREVVGVVADAQLDTLGAVPPVIFQPAESVPYLLFQEGTVGPDRLRAIITAADDRATVTIDAVGNNVSTSLEAASHGARAAGGLSVLALVLVAAGTAGVFAFVVSERTREISIRLALGGSRSRVRRLLLRRTGRPIVIGLSAGLLLAFLAGPVLRSYLYGFNPADPFTYFLAVVVVALTAWIATVAPIRRALRVDPAVTLRHE